MRFDNLRTDELWPFGVIEDGTTAAIGAGGVPLAARISDAGREPGTAAGELLRVLLRQDADLDEREPGPPPTALGLGDDPPHPDSGVQHRRVPGPRPGRLYSGRSPSTAVA